MTTPFKTTLGFGTGAGGDDVNRLHDYDDIDLGNLSHHHSLGIRSGQSSPGDHIHDGKTSKALSIGGATPATLVSSEVAYGIVPAVGVGTKYSREDHTHGSPATPSIPAASAIITTETAFGQASAVGAAVSYSRGDHTHGTPAAPAALTPASSVVTELVDGQVQAVGVSLNYARQDHTHGSAPSQVLPAASASVVTETAFAQASAVGVATTFSKGDHTHGTPAAPVIPAASATVVSETAFAQAAAVGVAATFSKGDHTHGTPASGTGTAAISVTDQRPYGLAQVIGVSASYARQDHNHGSHPTPLVFTGACSAQLILTTANVDVAGMTVTINPVGVNSLALVWVTCFMRCTATPTALTDIVGELFLAGVAQAGTVLGDGANLNRANSSNQWMFAVGAGSKIIKVQGRKSNATPTCVIDTPHSRLNVLVLDIP